LPPEAIEPPDALVEPPVVATVPPDALEPPAALGTPPVALTDPPEALEAPPARDAPPAEADPPVPGEPSVVEPDPPVLPLAFPASSLPHPLDAITLQTMQTAQLVRTTVRM
jgi:hypothetical protein